jgi:hypothetical protein
VAPDCVPLPPSVSESSVLNVSYLINNLFPVCKSKIFYDKRLIVITFKLNSLT